jgi:putative endonuclease
MNNKVVGRQGEEIAFEYLMKQNPSYRLLEKNFSCRLGEIDLIMLDGEEVVFIEVKTRRSKSFGMPYEAVTSLKMTKIRRVAEYFRMIKNLEEREVRFDVVSIYLGLEASPAKIEHLVAAF